MSNTRILYLFTRTPLHVGAGAGIGAIEAVKAFQGQGEEGRDQPGNPGVGGDASTGLGYYTAQLAIPCQPL